MTDENVKPRVSQSGTKRKTGLAESKIQPSHTHKLFIEGSLGKYRAIKMVGWRVNFPTDAITDFEGLLAVNREICKRQMSEKAPPDKARIQSILGLAQRAKLPRLKSKI